MTRMLRRSNCLVAAVIVSVIAARAWAADGLIVSGTAAAGAVPLAAGDALAAVFVDAGDAKVVHIAADLFAGDIERVVGRRPTVTQGPPAPTGDTPVVIIGTLGQSHSIDSLVAAGKLDVSHVSGRWEAYTLAVVTDPMPGVKQAIVIAGSDRRGTAFGVFTLSEAIGVSPWYWWADVTPTKKSSLYVSLPKAVHDAPAVKYRGIFINDEDWGLQPWAAKTFEPDVGDIGPKTYAKVCELLLRLRGNYLWPAMHPSTKAFNIYPQNKVVADDYAIVMGSSHAEPMLRNNVTEWSEKQFGAWDWQKNRDGVSRYWETRVQENGQYENVYTVGMRGIHDSAMPGAGSLQKNIAQLEDVIATQRDMLKRHVNADPAKVPQVFVPYKEVLPLYLGGCRVPDDVTLVWPDDNHGFVRRLSTPQEQKRAGGAGVYYHLSYWGVPEDFLWLDTQPISLIWSEMSKAFDYGADHVWVANVGDIKPQEKGMDFFLRMAWNPKAWNENSQMAFLDEWAERSFGHALAPEIVAVVDHFYRLNSAVKPEHLTPANANNLSWTNYDEAPRRLAEFAGLVEQSDALYARVPAASRDAYYQLVAYPVRCSALMNVKQLNAARSRALVLQKDPAAAKAFAERAIAAQAKIDEETRYYNDALAGAKWMHMMSARQRGEAAFQPPDVDGKAKAAATGRRVGPPAVAVAPSSQSTTRPARSVVALPAGVSGFVEADGVVSIEAEHPTRRTGGGGATWAVMPGLGRNSDAITPLPSTAPTADVHDGMSPDALTAALPSLAYDFATATAGPATVRVYCLPTHAVNDTRKLRFAVAVDDAAPTLIDLDTLEFSREWSVNILRHAAVGTSDWPLEPGRHTLTVWAADPGVVFDKIVVDLGGLKPSFLGPPETLRRP